MVLYLSGHDFAYELENVARMFMRDVRVEKRAPKKADRTGDWAQLRRARTGGEYMLLCSVRCGVFSAAKTQKLPVSAGDAECELALAQMLYDLLCSLTSTSPPWGVMTGIRPAKFVGAMLRQGMRDTDILWRLETRCRVSADKAALCLETAKTSEAVAALNTPRSFSLYAAIPFCPTRCAYCSFVSKSVERDKSLIAPYVDALCGELALVGGEAARLGLRLESVYIGGGTPTTLSAPQLEQLTRAIADSFDLSAAREYSVEAGRPDTIDADKLDVLRRAGVTRLSINPQTANDEVLRALGRRHTAADIERSFRLAREAGFDNINADLIAGLPGDTLESFAHTLSWLRTLGPENVTVHALTLKRASRLNEDGTAASPDAAAMVDLAGRELPAWGLRPYYMYKQKGTVDNLENTGYALPGKECLYNVYIMDELHTILACGAGAVTKLVDQRGGLIRRIFNYKYPAEYLAGCEEIRRRKGGIREFYESNIQTESTL
ncbi:MAG: coproporphyrinogen dehydrogenase HemZ [Oscillospiraceae bacterium]|nr:coproporphyrinogen dehydrogenase HemZ [Oscillospiraceae bacterium]